jgi:hypothetical protein
MNRPQAILIAFLVGIFLYSDVAALNQETKTDTKSSASSTVIIDTQTETIGSLTAAKLCTKSDYQCVNHAINISLLKEDGSTYKTKLQPPTPVIHGGNVHIYAGQTIYVEADMSKGKLTGLRLVQTLKHPDKTLILRLTQQTKSKEKTSMLLLIYNPFDKNLKYHAHIVSLDDVDDSGNKTITCPVKVKNTAAEIWPNPLVQVILKDFKLIDPKTKRVCEY